MALLKLPDGDDANRVKNGLASLGKLLPCYFFRVCFFTGWNDAPCMSLVISGGRLAMWKHGCELVILAS